MKVERWLLENETTDEYLIAAAAFEEAAEWVMNLGKEQFQRSRNPMHGAYISGAEYFQGTGSICSVAARYLLARAAEMRLTSSSLRTRPPST